MGRDDLRGDTGAGTAAGAVGCAACDVETIAQVRQVGDVNADFISDVLHAVDLVIARGKSRL